MTSDDKFLQAYTDCRLCPRRCGVNRAKGELGFCRESSRLRIASASLHMGEEPSITGRGGSGTIFISGCNLGCLFCQNWDISHAGSGRSISHDELVRIILQLQNSGAENINLVTPTHATPALAAGIKSALKKGLRIPVIWNSSSYETLEALSMLEGIIDVWLPDLKTLDYSISSNYLNAPDYPEAAEKAILHMLENSELRFSSKGSITSGVIIRHLVLPGHLDSSREVLEWFAKHARGRALLSLMTQYSPNRRRGSEICPNRGVSKFERETLVKWLGEFEIKKGYFQNLVLA